MKVNKRPCIVIAIVAILLLPLFILIFSPNKQQSAKAISYVQFDYAEYKNFDGDIALYNTQNPVYARNIKLYYEVFSPYYIIEVSKANVVITATQAITPIDNKGEYEVIDNGELTVYCYATDEEGVKQENTRIYTQIKSDNLSPNSALINEMTQWRRHESGYLVNIQIGSDNGNAGIKKADISVIYSEHTDSRTIVFPTSTDSFFIYEECTITITMYDNAGNMQISFHTFNKFDSTKPTPPAFTAVPEKEISEQTNGFARTYYVTVSYGEDDKSGIKDGSMICSVNGESFVYDGGFTLNEQMNYYITALYQDNAGNTSDSASLNITNIDRINPSINSLSLIVDLMQQSPYKITIACSDSDSGIDRIEAEGINAEFHNRIYNIYDCVFDSLDKSLIKINVYDNVGNYTFTNLITHHFGNLDIEDLAVEYNEKFFLLNSEEYSEQGWNRIIDLYTLLNIMLMTEDTTIAEFESMATQIDDAIEGKTQYSYKINGVPQHISTNINYVINEDVIQNIKKGDSIRMTLKDTEFDPTVIAEFNLLAKNKTDFETCFISPFKLTFYHNETEIEYQMTNGAEITMPVPAGYEARYYAIIDMQTEELIDVEVINNKITFTINGGGCYALITEGEVITNTETKPRGIDIFGKTISYLAFGLTLGGIILLTAVAITLLSLRYKKNTTDK